MTTATLDPTWQTNLRDATCADCGEPAYSRKGVFARPSRDGEAGKWQPQCPACHIAGGECRTPSLCKAPEPMPEEYKERLRQMAEKRAPRVEAAGRHMEPGTKLVGAHKGTEYTCMVVLNEEGATRYRLEDGREFKSPSAAGSAVLGGRACNGWTFWARA